MTPRVLLTRVAVEHPPYWVDQGTAAWQIGEATGEMRRVLAVSRGTGIKQRAVCLPPDQIGRLGGIEARNQIYKQVAPGLAIAAASEVSCGHSVGCVVSTSCTGYMVPSWDVRLATELSLQPHTVRLPITESGCAGGVVAIARAAEHLRLHPDQTALAVSVELCSLAFHPRTEPGNLTSALIFGDGAGAALLEAGDSDAQDGLEVIDALSTLVPCSSDALGFDLTDAGFYPVLQRELVEILPGPTCAAVNVLLSRHGLDLSQVGFCLVHPGGARVLSGLQAAFDVKADDLRWSWESMKACGNMSSASIFDVIRRYLADSYAPRGWGLVIAFGPGVSIEMLLVRRC
jgi:alkylresorcinol/alkylpyrone synthase